MEFEGDEAFSLQPKRSKFTSMQHSTLQIPDSFPEELTAEILLRLPVKSLLQFRTVSKSWFHFISSPIFVKTQLCVCANNKDYTHHRLILGFDSQYSLKGCSLSSLLYDSITEAYDLDYPMKNNTNRYAFVAGSVNGLICFKIEGKFFLWNPSIRKVKKLCDTRDGYYPMYGFGYDELHEDYKVVGVCRYRGSDGLQHAEAKIYSLNRNSWISIDNFQRGPLFNKEKGMFANGKLHWANTSRNFRSFNGWDIISIDLANGKWGMVEKPYYGEGDFEFTLCLGVLGSDLSLFCNSWRG